MITFSRRPEFNDYLHPEFLKRLPVASIRRLVELGCHDGKDTLDLLQAFPQARIHAFECHPEMAAEARTRYTPSDRVTLVEKAAWDENGIIPFYPVVRTFTEKGEEIENVGASSCYKARPDYLRKYEQKEIRVEATRLDSYCREKGLEKVDLLCLDVQGAMLRVLKGWGEKLSSVRYIIAEIEHRPLYYDQDLFPEIDGFLRQAGFEPEVRVLRDDWFSDYLYINTREGVKRGWGRRLRSLWKS